MMRLIYSVVATLALPAVAGLFFLRAKLRPQLPRFRADAPSCDAPPLWIHACSVGEVNTARPLIETAARRWPETPVVLTVSTPTGRAHAEDLGLAARVTWLPIDHPLIVRRFIGRLRPRALVLIETELWPGALAESHGAGVPVLLVNGRLSDKRASLYGLLAPLLRPFVAPLAAAAMQNRRYAERIARFGVPPDRIHVLGNMKFDGAATPHTAQQGAELRETLGIAENTPVLLFGSTRPGDEALAARCWADLRETSPGLRLIVAPRHLDRLDEARAPFNDEDVALWSELKVAKSDSNDKPIIFIDTHGELPLIYSAATVAVIGGSFFPGVDGHNPIEPAAVGVPVVFGPHMRNFRDPAAALVEHGAALQVSAADALTAALKTLLDDPAARARMGENAQTVIAENQGALDRTLDLIAGALDRP